VPLFSLRCAALVERQIFAMRRWKIWLFCCAEIGARAVIEKGCIFSPGAWLIIGKEVHIGRNSSFYMGEKDSLCPRPVQIGDRTWISDGFLLLSISGVKIGNNVLIGEYVSIRDATHDYRNSEVNIRDQADVHGTLVIEDDVWIGRGCLIQGKPEGVVIGRGAIIGANSVVTRSIPAMEIWGGVPARFIKSRAPSNDDPEMGPRLT
jgi:acetyltransferase-like isoleucine patch superfamily enzyme